MEFEYEIFPTGADGSRQNPVEQIHRTVADGVRDDLIGAGLDISFWPFAFRHFLRT